MSRERSNSGSIELGDAKIIDDGDQQDSREFSGEISGLDSEYEDSGISEESLQRIFSSFSPEKPKTIEEFEIAYNRVRGVIESEKKFFTAKKIESRLIKEDIEILKKQIADLRSANESLQQKNVSLQQENERLVQDAIQRAEIEMAKMNDKIKKGGTLKRRKKRNVSRRKN